MVFFSRVERVCMPHIRWAKQKTWIFQCAHTANLNYMTRSGCIHRDRHRENMRIKFHTHNINTLRKYIRCKWHRLQPRTYFMLYDIVFFCLFMLNYVEVPCLTQFFGIFYLTVSLNSTFRFPVHYVVVPSVFLFVRHFMQINTCVLFRAKTEAR